MKILARSLSGSQLYGTATPESDFDYKVLFLPSLKDMLMGKKIEISKQRPEGLGPNAQMIAGEEESEHIPLQKFAKDFIDGQTWALELAFAMNQEYLIDLVPESHKELLQTFNTELIDKFLTNNINKMVGYAISQAQAYGLKGERLSTVERLIADLDLMLEQNIVQTDGRLFDLEEWFKDNTSEFLFLTKIKGTKSTFEEQPAVQINNRTYSLTTAIGHFRKALDILKAKYGTRAAASQQGVDWKALSHAIRVAHEALSLLKNKTLTFPSTISPLLLQVKNGEVPYEEAIRLFKEINTTMEEALVTTKLQDRTSELLNEFNRWLENQLLKFYEIPE